MTKLANFFIINSKLTIVLSILVLIFGYFGIKKMNTENFPAVSFATAIVTTSYDGATADDIEAKITKPIEDEIKGISGIKDIKSVSMSGLSSIVIRVDSDKYDVNTVMDDIQKKVDNTPNLPIDLIDKPEFEEINSSEIPVYEVAVIGSNANRQRDLAAEELEEILENIREVKEVNLSGHSEREFNIKLDSQKLNENYISISEVMSKIGARNVNIPGGKLQDEKDEILLRIEGKIKDKEDLGNFLIRSNFSGKQIFLKDIAEIIDGEKERTIHTRYNGEPATSLVIIKKAGEDAIKLVNELKPLIEEFEKSNKNKDLEFKTVLDESKEVATKIKILFSNAQYGLILVIMFLFIFLPGRIGIAASISLPLTIMATFGMMSFLGMNLNTITILALIISIGMLVDNSVVMSEIYTRHRQEGFMHKKAALMSISDIAGPITASALTTIAAFLPMLVTTGVMGSFIYAIPIVITLALLFSLAESFLLLPMRLTTVAANITKNKKNSDDRKIYKVLENGFKKVLSFTIKHSYITLISFFLVIFASLTILTKFNKFELFPAEQTEVYFARIEAPSGSTLEHTDKLAAKLSKQIKEKLAEKIDYVSSTVGKQQVDVSDPKGGTGPNLGLIRIDMTDDAKKNTKEDFVLKKLQEIDASYFKSVSYEALANGPPVGADVEAKFRSNNNEELDKIINLVLNDLKEVKGIYDLKIDDVIGEDEVFVKIDFSLADRVGLTTNDIGNTIRTAISGKIASTVTLNNKDVDLKVRFKKLDRKKISDLLNLKIRNSQGQLIALSKIATFERKIGSPQIKRYNNKRARTILANVDKTIITPIEVDEILLNIFNKYKNEVNNVSLYQGGLSETTNESLESLANAFIFAIIGIFAVLIYIFNSYIKPLIILSTIPLGLFGISIAFYFHDRPVSFLALIGVVGLSGIIVNAGIVLISHIENIRKEQPEENIKNILFKAAISRFRPILITTLTTMSGLFPTAYGLGGSDPTLIPITLAMAWGLTTGSLFTLIWVPSAYYIIETLPTKIKILIFNLLNLILKKPKKLLNKLKK